MHFFIDHTAFPTTTQIVENSYGPIVGDEENIYKVTSEFILDDATSVHRAFACMSGLIIVQQSDVDEDMVNLVLKPSLGIDIPFNNVRYFIYRGLKKSSFINVDDDITAAGVSGNSEFIERIWDELDQRKVDEPTAPDPIKESIGYDNSLSGSTRLDEVFWGKFDAKPIYVKEGEWIGDFYQDNGDPHLIGIDIMLDSSLGKFDPDLSFVRSGNFLINATGLTGLVLKAKRDQILGFIDPAAFFGLHFYDGLKTSTYSGVTKTTVPKKEDELYTDLLTKFFTANRVYLDVRSEKGYSYNYYSNYDDGSGNQLKIGNSSTTPVAQVYSSNAWPLIYFDSGLATTEEQNDLIINLRLDDNTKPVIFIENSNLLGNRKVKKFINYKELLNSDPANYSKDVKLYFPNNGTGATKDNVSYYLKLMYFRTEFNEEAPTTVFNDVNYYNNGFNSIDLPDLGNPEIPVKHIYNPEVFYVNGIINETEFAYITKAGSFFDSERILFYKNIIYINKPFNESYIGQGVDNEITLMEEYPPSLFHSNLKSNVDKFRIIVDSEDYFFNVVSINHFNSLFPDRSQLNLIGLTLDELENLKILSGLSSHHLRYIAMNLKELSPFIDEDGKNYNTYDLKIVGLDNFADFNSVSSDESVNSTDNLGFTSLNFAEQELFIEDIANIKFNIVPLKTGPEDVNEFYKNIISRLSVFDNNVLSGGWPLYNLKGRNVIYGVDETNYINEDISGQQIVLPFGTRVLKLGTTLKEVNGMTMYYVVCFHESRYREGFVDSNAFTNSNIGFDETVRLRINQREGEVHPEIVALSFLDDSFRIKDYIDRIIGTAPAGTIGSLFLTMASDIAINLSDLLSEYDPYHSTEFAEKLITLNSLVHDNDHLGYNINNKVETLGRWKTELLDQLISHLKPTQPFRGLLCPLSYQWLSFWEYKEPGLNELTIDTVTNAYPGTTYKFSEIYKQMGPETGYGGTSGVPGDDYYYGIVGPIQMMVDKYHDSTEINDFTLTPEFSWIKSLYFPIPPETPYIFLPESEELTNEHFYKQLVQCVYETWADNLGSEYGYGGIFGDHSIGYINNIGALDVFYHEIQTSNPSDAVITGHPRPLFFDTHGFDSHLYEEFNTLKQNLIEEGAAIKYFEDFTVTTLVDDGCWLAFGTNPHGALPFLDYLLKKLITL